MEAYNNLFDKIDERLLPILCETKIAEIASNRINKKNIQTNRKTQVKLNIKKFQEIQILNDRLYIVL